MQPNRSLDADVELASPSLSVSRRSVCSTAKAIVPAPIEQYSREFRIKAVPMNDHPALTVLPRRMMTRHHPARSAWRLAALTALCTGAAPALAATCEELQQSVEARIRANGVDAFSVTLVDAGASAPGQVVGTCDQGRKKLMYVRGAAEPGAAAKPRPAEQKIITECADGRVLTEGTCK